MKRLRTVMVCCAVASLASLLLARIHPFGDAGLFDAKGAEDPIMGNSNVPPAVQTILIAKCADCHSAQTRAPIYGHFAPVSWLMERDINEGRRVLNLSQWNTYGPDRQQIEAAKIVELTRERDMPLLQYRIIHRSARITEADMNTFLQWARGLQTPGTSIAMQATGEGDPVRGKDLFERRCIGCHSLTQNREGPSLHGVYGRASASVEDFGYSSALKTAHVVWDETTLEKWLTDPDEVVRGSNMDFHVGRPQERKDLISYLRKEAGK